MQHSLRMPYHLPQTNSCKILLLNLFISRNPWSYSNICKQFTYPNNIQANRPSCQSKASSQQQENDGKNSLWGLCGRSQGCTRGATLLHSFWEHFVLIFHASPRHPKLFPFQHRWLHWPTIFIMFQSGAHSRAAAYAPISIADNSFQRKNSHSANFANQGSNLRASQSHCPLQWFLGRNLYLHEQRNLWILREVWQSWNKLSYHHTSRTFSAVVRAFCNRSKLRATLIHFSSRTLILFSIQCGWRCSCTQRQYNYFLFEMVLECSQLGSSLYCFANPVPHFKNIALTAVKMTYEPL